MNEKEYIKDNTYIDWPMWVWIKVREFYENIKESTFSILNKIKS